RLFEVRYHLKSALRPLGRAAMNGDEESQPREWFAVLFGTRRLNGDRSYIDRYTDVVRSICLEEGVLLTDRPHRRAVLEDDDVDNLLHEIRKTLDSLQRKHKDDIHFPLVLVVDDQTLCNVHDQYIEPSFSDEAFIYSLKAPKLQEFLAMNSWDQVRADIQEQKKIFDEFNPLPKIQAPAENRSRNFRDDEEGYGRGASRHRQPLDEEELRHARRDEGQHHRAREEQPLPVERRPPPKIEMTPDAVLHALGAVDRNPKMAETLAEDMHEHIRYELPLQLPRRVDDLVNMLELFLIAGENSPSGLNPAETKDAHALRTELTKSMHQSGLLLRVREENIGTESEGLHVSLERGQLSEKDLKDIGRAINMVLRGFIMIAKYDLIDDESLDLWGRVETPVFSLPGRFWLTITEQASDTLCQLAAKVTTQDPAMYKENVQMLVEEEQRRLEEERRLEADDRRVQNGRAAARRGRGDEPGPSAYKYDPYHMEDSDSPDMVQHQRESRPARDPDDSRGSTPTVMDLDPEFIPADTMEEVGGREYGRGREEYRRRVERGRENEEVARRAEQRRREEAVWREEQRRQEELIEAAAELARAEAEAAERREYERMRHENALAQLEKRKQWEETNDQCVAWRDSNEAPPTSFRTLAVRPVYGDLFQPKMPYMRKALVSGAYSDNDNYLDVQFRLMREDMVAPLRDGIYEQKILTDPGKLISSSNDLKIYPTIEVGALQVRSIDGAPMRVVTIPQHILFQIREERQLKFGNCVVLSSDKFTREFHIGWICDRFQEPGMPWQGRLAIAFFDEGLPPREGTKPIDKMATYALAESPAYLEAYIHVLRVLKKMRKNVAFPLERYLVHMKKNTRLPQYMRWKEKDEDKEEDRERQAMYEKKRKEAEAKEKEKAKKKGKKVLSRSGSRQDDEVEVTSEEHVTTEEGVSEENLADDGFNTDEEDSFLTGGRHTHPNPKDLETISIQGRSYNVERLMDEFQTTSLDETQRKAMCYALTSELAIIQGPPGTGKTHIGVEIVMAILENRIKWRMTEPILIVTFSNQALDHFLDKIRVQIEARGLASEDTPPVVRLGSRSEHDAIKLNCLLGTVMKDYEEDLAGEAFNEKMKQRKHKDNALKTLVRAVKTVQISRNSIMEYNTLRQVIDSNMDQQLRQAAYGLRDSSGNPLNMDEVLVSWLLNKSYEKRRDLPPGSDDDSEKEEKEWAGAMGGRAVQHKPVSKKSKAKGRETKKEKNERKRAEKRHQWRESEDSSDTEDEDESSESVESEGEEGEDGEGPEHKTTEEILEMLSKLNANAQKEASTAASEEKWRRMAEKYEMEEDWEVEKEFAARNNGRMLISDVEIFSHTVKQAAIRGRGGKGDRQQVNVDPNIVRDIHEHKQYILAKEQMTTDEVRSIRDVRTLPKEARWRLLVTWQNSLAAWKRNSLDAYMTAFEKACEKAEYASDISRAAVLKKALIVGATTTGSAKRRALISRIGPKVLVVEEAAEVLEAHLLASIVPSVQHAIFIGDHQQLRPSTAVHHLAKMANMEVSLFERLVKNDYPYHTLGLQHRMLAPLTEHVVRPFFYKKLQDAPSVLEYPRVAGMASNMFFWAHRSPEDTVNDSMSKRNCAEAEMCFSLANYILRQGQYKPSEITIIGMYGAQVTEIKRGLQNVGGSLSDVAVETVDSFQGKENRIMILSLVRSLSGGVGFLAIPNRITVALTRAQHGMYVCGNLADIASYSELWHNIAGQLNGVGLIDYGLPVVCQRHGHESVIRTHGDFLKKAKWGGCTEMCGMEMACGHICKHQCHPPYQHGGPSAEGPNLECREQCSKRCEKCGQLCERKCQEPCGVCHKPVTLELDCGHTVRCECGTRNLARCKEPCAVTLDCGHTCQNRCSVDCVPVEKCEQGVPFIHPICKHDLVLPCNKVLPYMKRVSMATPACYEPCPERLVCGHKCPRNCGEPCPTMCDAIVNFEGDCGHRLLKKCSEEKRHIKCTALVDSAMPHCTHRIKMECYQSRNQNECRSACKKPTACGHECTLSCGECYKRASAHECSALCARDLPCGHRCQGRCGKPCVCRASCRVRCSHQRCGPMSRDTKGGALSYGRNCSQPCVTCIEPCDNHCEHKSCSKKCFEVCDVKEPCSEPCREVLRCGHACLGLCGETCPKLCGTCSTMNYKQTIEKYAVESSTPGELTRLIELPGCDHIFPYKHMDQEVRKQLAAGCIVLRCPRCNGMIDDCKRYIRVTKRLWKEADDRKWEQKMADEDMSKAELMQKYGQMRAAMTYRQDDVARYYKVVLSRCGDKRAVFAFETYGWLDVLYKELSGQIAVVDSRNEFFYWQAVISCHMSICGLVLDYLQKWELIKVEVTYDKQVNLKSVMEEAFDRRRSRIFPMRDQFKAMVCVVKDSLEYRKVGQLVPTFRAAMTKSHLYYHMEHLYAALRGRLDDHGAPVDLTPTQAVTYKRVIKMILKDPPSEQPHKKLEDMMAKIGSDVYAKLLRTEYVSPKVFKVELPEF
ncbi:hypothetical protein PMAYCL1PPCAC_03111, partial [Pristionchus mayeri]